MLVEHVDCISVPVTDLQRSTVRCRDTLGLPHAGDGVEFIDETYDSRVCHMAPFADRDGNRFMLHSRHTPAE